MLRPRHTILAQCRVFKRRGTDTDFRGGIVAEESLPRQKKRLNTMADQRLDLSADTVPDNAADLTLFVQNLLEQMQGRFNTMSSSIISRIDEMGNRIDDLEKSIGELMQQVRRGDGDAIALHEIKDTLITVIVFLSQAGVDPNAADGGDDGGKK